MNLQEALEGVVGFFNGGEAQLLHDLVAELRLPQMYLEVGTYQGRSLIAAMLDAQVPGFAVDPHVTSPGDPFPFGDQDRAALMANLVRTGLAWKVRILDMQSEWASRGWPGHHIGILFIDGGHDLASVRMDLNGWLPFVDDQAYVCFHDMTGQAIQDAIAERGDLLTHVKTVELTGVFRYNRPKPPAEKIKQAVETVNTYTSQVQEWAGSPSPATWQEVNPTVGNPNSHVIDLIGITESPYPDIQPIEPEAASDDQPIEYGTPIEPEEKPKSKPVVKRKATKK